MFTPPKQTDYLIKVIDQSKVFSLVDVPVRSGWSSLGWTCPLKVHLIHPLPDDRLHVVVPLVMSVCEVSSPADEAVLASLSFQFGKLCSGLAGGTQHTLQTRRFLLFWPKD